MLRATLALLSILMTAGCELLAPNESKIELRNMTPDVIRTFYHTPCGTLSQPTILATDVRPGEARLFSVEPGCYRVVATFDRGSDAVVEAEIRSNHRLLVRVWKVTVTIAGRSGTVGDGGGRYLRPALPNR